MKGQLNCLTEKPPTSRMNGTHYENPPLRETVCEFRFAPESQWDLSLPGLIYARLQKQFPKKLSSRSSSIAATITIGPEGSQQRIEQAEEFRFWREDELGAIKIGPHLLSITHYKPYPTWPKVLPVIKQALEAYLAVAEPKAFQRIGLRYINEFLFDANPTVELEDYFDFYPFLGDRMSKDFGSFIVGVHLLFEEDDRDALRVQLSPSVGNEESKLPIILDLDYSLLRPGEVTFDRVYDWLEVGHSRIEETFEGSIKPRLRERFGEVIS